MSKKEQNNGPDSSNIATNYAKFAGVAFQMLVIIGLFTFIGYKIDDSAGHTTQWVTAVMSLIGVFISLFIVIRSLKS